MLHMAIPDAEILAVRFFAVSLQLNDASYRNVARRYSHTSEYKLPSQEHSGATFNPYTNTKHHNGQRHRQTDREMDTGQTKVLMPIADWLIAVPCKVITLADISVTLVRLTARHVTVT